MNALGAIFVVFLIVAIAYFLRGSVDRSEVPSGPPEVTLADIPYILKALTLAKQEGSFAVLLFGPEGDEPALTDALNVQFSVESGVVGLDWPLLSPLNIAAENKVTSFWTDAGFNVELQEANDVSTLRVQGGDLAMLCEQLLTELFGVEDDQPLGLIIEGFEWSDEQLARAIS
jgi:hypothetical protein